MNRKLGCTFVVRTSLVLALIALSGCAKDLVQSTNVKDATGEKVGVAYALPKGQVQLVAQRKMILAEDVAKAQAEATEADLGAKTAKGALDAAKAALEKSKGELNSAKPPAVEELKKQVALDQATVDYLTIVAETKKRIAAAAKKTLEERMAGVGRFEESASITSLPNVPDPKTRFIADFQHSVMRSDNSKLTVSNGLLSTTAVTSTDETKAILVSLAGVVGTLFGIPTFPASKIQGFLETPPPDAAPECQPYSYARIFDPTDREETIFALAGLHQKKSSFAVDVDGLHCTGGGGTCDTSGTARNMPGVSALQAGANAQGLVYRAPRSVAISVAPVGNPNCKLVGQPGASSAVVVVPDSTSSFVLPAKGGSFTTATIGHSFKDGMLTEYSQAQPSEVAGFASIPIEVLKAVVSVPAEILKLRVDYDSQANAGLEGRIKEQELQLRLLSAQRELEAARAAAATTTGP